MLGMSLLFLPHKDVVYSFAVVDTQGLPNTAGFNTLFQDPTTLTHEVRVTVRPFGLTGHQLLGVAWANKPFTLLPEDKRTILGNILFGTPLKTTSNNWGFTTISISICTRTSTIRLEALGSFFAPAYQTRGRALSSNSIAAALAAKGSSRGVRTIDLASAIIISNSATTFLPAFAGW